MLLFFSGLNHFAAVVITACGAVPVRQAHLAAVGANDGPLATGLVMSPAFISTRLRCPAFRYSHNPPTHVFGRRIISDAPPFVKGIVKQPSPLKLVNPLILLELRPIDIQAKPKKEGSANAPFYRLTVFAYARGLFVVGFDVTERSRHDTIRTLPGFGIYGMLPIFTEKLP
jgi:hypothetical protein